MIKGAVVPGATVEVREKRSIRILTRTFTTGGDGPIYYYWRCRREGRYVVSFTQWKALRNIIWKCVRLPSVPWGGGGGGGGGGGCGEGRVNTRPESPGEVPGRSYDHRDAHCRYDDDRSKYYNKRIKRISNTPYPGSKYI
jgi:hypothetical protein